MGKYVYLIIKKYGRQIKDYTIKNKMKVDNILFKISAQKVSGNKKDE